MHCIVHGVSLSVYSKCCRKNDIRSCHSSTVLTAAIVSAVSTVLAFSVVVLHFRLVLQTICLKSLHARAKTTGRKVSMLCSAYSVEQYFHTSMELYSSKLTVILSRSFVAAKQLFPACGLLSRSMWILLRLVLYCTNHFYK